MGESQSGIVAATFDVWETLITDNRETSGKRAQARASKMAEVLQGHGYDTNPLQVRQAYSQMLERLEREVWSKYLDVGTEEQLSVFLSVFDPELSASARKTLLIDLEDAYTIPIFDYPPVLAPGADWALGSVQLMGFRLGLICNTGVTPGRDIRKLLDGYGVLKYFETLTFSDEERIRKPQPAVFERTLQRMGLTPSQGVHIGDDAVSDIAGAKGAGMRAIMVRASLASKPPVSPDARVDDLYSVPNAIEDLS